MSLCFFLSNGSENGIIEGKERVERKGIDNRLRFGVKYRKTKDEIMMTNKVRKLRQGQECSIKDR